MSETYHSSTSLIPLGFFRLGPGTKAISPKLVPGTPPKTTA